MMFYKRIAASVPSIETTVIAAHWLGGNNLEQSGLGKSRLHCMCNRKVILKALLLRQGSGPRQGSHCRHIGSVDVR